MQNSIIEQNAEHDASASFWATEWGCNAIYKDVPVGGRFRYRASPPNEYFVKEQNGFRQFRDGKPHGPKKLYRTGQRTAVVWIRAEA